MERPILDTYRWVAVEGLIEGGSESNEGWLVSTVVLVMLDASLSQMSG